MASSSESSYGYQIQGINDFLTTKSLSGKFAWAFLLLASLSFMSVEIIYIRKDYNDQRFLWQSLGGNLILKPHQLPSMHICPALWLNLSKALEYARYEETIFKRRYQIYA